MTKDKDSVKRQRISTFEFENAYLSGISPYVYRDGSRHKIFAKFLALDFDSQVNHKIDCYASLVEGLQSARSVITFLKTKFVDGFYYLLQKSKSGHGLHLLIFTKFVNDNEEIPALYYKKGNWKLTGAFKDFIETLSSVVEIDLTPMTTRNLWLSGTQLPPDAFEVIEESNCDNPIIVDDTLTSEFNFFSTSPDSLNLICPALLHYTKPENQQHQTEEIWWLLARVCRYLDNYDLFLEWSASYPNFNESDASHKFKTCSKIYPSCNVMSWLFAKDFCCKCRHQGKIFSSSQPNAVKTKKTVVDINNLIEERILEIFYNPINDTVFSLVEKLLRILPDNIIFVINSGNSYFFDVETKKRFFNIKELIFALKISIYTFKIIKKESVRVTLQTYSSVIKDFFAISDITSYGKNIKIVKKIKNRPGISSSGSLIIKPGIHDSVYWDFEPVDLKDVPDSFVSDFLHKYSFSSEKDYVFAFVAMLSSFSSEYFGCHKTHFFYHAEGSSSNAWDSTNAGKTTLAQTTALIKSNEILETGINNHKQLQDWTTKTESAILSGIPSVLIDNISTQSKGDYFDLNVLSLWTSTNKVQMRLFHTQKIHSVEEDFDTSFFITGRDVILSQDLQKRFAIINFSGPVKDMKEVNVAKIGNNLAWGLAKLWNYYLIDGEAKDFQKFYDFMFPLLQNFKKREFWKKILKVVSSVKVNDIMYYKDRKESL